MIISTNVARPGLTTNSRGLTLAAMLAVASAFVACEDNNRLPPRGGRDSIATVGRAVVGAATQSNPWFVVTVETEGACSGTIYKARWVITAAHCFPDSWNTDASDFFRRNRLDPTELENAGNVKIAGGPDATGQSISYNALNVFKQDGTNWGQAAGNNDVVLVELPSPGFSVDQVSGYTSYYHASDGVQVLNLDQWATSTLGVTSWVVNYGYSTVSLGFATGQVTDNFSTYYRIGLLDGKGVAQQGDSGGPGFWLGGNVWGPGDVYYHVGVTTTSDSTTFSDHVGIGANGNKSWIEAVAGS
jgi:hypothetical protein